VSPERALILLIVLAALVGGGGLGWWWWRRARARPRLRRRRFVPARPRYPVLLVHGLFGFDELVVGKVRHAYYRGVREVLEQDGHAVQVARLPAVGAIAARAAELVALVNASGSKRVNIIAHSMGGLDARYAVSRLGLAKRVGALVTVGTPHRGSPVADLSSRVLEGIGLAKALSVAGVSVDALRDLTSQSLARFNEEVPDRREVAYASVVGVVRHLKRASPLLVPSCLWLKQTVGANDGVVPADSQRWGQVLAEIDADHWAQIGWSRHFDAAGFFRDLLRELRAMGY
jgi:triacylglycerol lipase